MKMNLAIFKCKNEFRKELGLEKQLKKMGSFVWILCLLPELWSLNCHFFADVSKKSKAGITIYAYISESFCFALLENSIGYYGMT